MAFGRNGADDREKGVKYLLFVLEAVSWTTSRSISWAAVLRVNERLLLVRNQ